MRIIKLLDRDSQDIEVPLLQMTNSGDRLEAFRGRKLLELVRHLQAQGPAPTASGNLRLGELWVAPYNVTDRVLVKIWVDWYDFSPLQYGLPEAHYRMQIKPAKGLVTRDARATSVPEAEQIILEAFGRSA